MTEQPILSPPEPPAAPDAVTALLFHHPFCPHSRFIRLTLGEYGLAVRLIEERVWERREAFLLLNPAGTTPVLVEEGHPAVPGADIIAEYLDEMRGAELDGRRLLPPEAGTRVERGACRGKPGFNFAGSCSSLSPSAIRRHLG